MRKVKFCFLILGIQFSIVFHPSKANTDTSSPMTVFASELENGKITIFARTSVDSLYSLMIEFTNLNNLRPSQTGPLIYNLEGAGSFELVSLIQVSPGLGYGYNWSYYWNYGFSGTSQNSDFVYRIPYTSKEKYFLSQGYLGDYSHHDIYALDWTMPEGTTLLAARGGKVIRVKEDSNQGGSDSSFKHMGNFVTIGHRDGSKAEYLHLKLNGALVEVGDEVKVGDPIGLAGNTGWSSGPHLHFQVYQQTDPQNATTISTAFMDRDGNLISLEEGEEYYGSADIRMNDLSTNYILDQEELEFANNWGKSTWLDSIYRDESGWFFHPWLEWIYPIKSLIDGVWFYHSSINWVWTRKDIFPWVFSSTEEQWKYLDRTKGIFDQSSKSWKSWK